MSLRNVAGLYLIRLRGRVGQELLAFAGIAVGVSLLFAALVANSSLTGSFERLTRGVVGEATVQVAARGSSTLDDALLRRTQALAGVSKAAAVLDLRGEANGPGGRASVVLTGVTPEFAELSGAYTRGFSYRFLSDVRAMALPTPLADHLDLALGELVTLTINGSVAQARLGAKLQRDDVGGLVNSPFALAPLRYAQELADQPGRISRIFVVPLPGQQEAVERAVTRLAGDRANVRPADFDAELFRQASVPTSQSTTMFSVFGAMVGFLFAFSAMLLTVPQRRQLMADLDAEGYRPATIVKVLLFDALALGVVASAAGIALGDQVARRLFEDTPSFLQYAFAIGSERIVAWEDVVLAAAGGLVASCVAVLGPTLPALRSIGSAERRHAPRAEGSGERRLAALGAVALAAGVAVVVAAPASAVLGIAGLACLTLAMLLLLPAVLSSLVALLDVVTSQMRSVVPFLVIFDLRDRTTRVRSLAVAATGAIAVFASVALQGAHADLLRGLDRTSSDVAGMGDVWALAPGEENLLVTTPFRLPEVGPSGALERVSLYRGGFLDVGGRRVRVFGPPADGPMPLSDVQVLEGDADEAADRLRTGGSVVLSEAVARDQGVEVGDLFTLPSPVPLRLRVVALSTNMGWPPGSVMIGAADYARGWDDVRPSAVLATLAPGTTPEEGRVALRAALGDETRLAVQTTTERLRAQSDAAREGVVRLAQIAALVLVSAALAMAATMAGLIWQRRRFLAGVKVEGYRTAELWKALLLEGAILIGAGCTAGAAFGLVGQGLLSRALTSVTGFPVVYSPALVGALLTCLAVTAAALAIVAVFGRRAADVSPESGLGG